MVDTVCLLLHKAEANKIVHSRPGSNYGMRMCQNSNFIGTCPYKFEQSHETCQNKHMHVQTIHKQSEENTARRDVGTFQSYICILYISTSY